MVGALHWSPAYIRKIEARPEGTNDVPRNFALIPYLQISPRLLGISDDFFIPDTPEGAHAALMQKLQPLLNDAEVHNDEIKGLIREYELTRVPNYLPLSAPAKQTFEEVILYYSVTVMNALEPLEYMNWLKVREEQIAEELGINRHTSWEIDEVLRRNGKIRYMYEKRLRHMREELLPASVVQREKLQEAIAWIEKWQEEVSREMDLSISFRRDQLLYVKCALYDALLCSAPFKREIYAELGSEKIRDYLSRWLTCACFLGNVVLMAQPLSERLNFFLQHDLHEEALKDFYTLQFCLDMMCNVFGLWSDVNAYVSALDRSISLAKGGMKTRLGSYQWRIFQIIQSRMAEMESLDQGSENDQEGL
jgi:hypothetical protein